jgi:hypothetical protein
LLPECFIKRYRGDDGCDPFTHHHGLGTWLRNYWGLWAGSRLAQKFNRAGIRHPDDMSHIILSYFCVHPERDSADSKSVERTLRGEKSSSR